MDTSSESKPCSRSLCRFMQKNIIVILFVLLCAGIGVGLLGSNRLAGRPIEAQARQHAGVTIDILNKTRMLSSKNVAKRVNSVEGVTLSPQYHSTDGAIPVPATFSIELAEEISDLKGGASFRLYSDFPFQNRKKTGGPRDSFEREALEFLRANPKEVYYSKEEEAGKPVMFRYAEAVLMQQSCVACHNSHDSSTKTDWQVGDVRGVITVAEPLEKHLLMAHEGVRHSFFILSSLALLAFVALSLVLSRLRLINSELEEKVNERTMDLNRLVNLDGLTQIANRRYFDSFLQQQWQSASLTRSPLSLLMCDVDCFKEFNDNYGHQEGDECLRKVAEILSRFSSQQNELAARYGGEEFVVLLPTADAWETAKSIQQRLMEVRIPHALSKVKPYVTLSIGISTLIPSVNQSSDTLIRAADQALYKAKGKGRDKCFVWDGTDPLRCLPLGESSFGAESPFVGPLS